MKKKIKYQEANQHFKKHLYKEKKKIHTHTHINTFAKHKFI